MNLPLEILLSSQHIAFIGVCQMRLGYRPTERRRYKFRWIFVYWKSCIMQGLWSTGLPHLVKFVRPNNSGCYCIQIQSVSANSNLPSLVYFIWHIIFHNKLDGEAPYTGLPLPPQCVYPFSHEEGINPFLEIRGVQFLQPKLKPVRRVRSKLELIPGCGFRPSDKSIKEYYRYLNAHKDQNP